MKETSRIFAVLAELLLSLIFLFSIVALSFLTSFSFSIFSHRDNDKASDDNGVQFGTQGVTTQTFILVLVGKELKSWLYTVYMWIFRRARFPIKRYGLWVPIVISEIVYALAQATLIFFISPFISDGGTRYFKFYIDLL